MNDLYEQCLASWSGPWTVKLDSREIARRCVVDGDYENSIERVAAFVDAARAYQERISDELPVA